MMSADVEAEKRVARMASWHYDKVVVSAPMKVLETSRDYDMIQREQIAHNATDILTNVLDYRGPKEPFRVWYRTPVLFEKDLALSRYIYGEDAAFHLESAAEVLLGPVVGMVTDTSAR